MSLRFRGKGSLAAVAISVSVRPSFRQVITWPVVVIDTTAE
jgi:hypothetical protein